KRLVTEEFAPKLFGVRQVLGPRLVFAIQEILLVRSEFQFLRVENVGNVFVLLIEALQKARENDSGWLRVAILENQIVLLRPIFFKFLQVSLREEKAQVVQRIDIAVEKLGGHFVIESLPRIMIALENARRDPRDIRIVRSRNQSIGMAAGQSFYQGFLDFLSEQAASRQTRD